VIEHFGRVFGCSMKRVSVTLLEGECHSCIVDGWISRS
jgi:hypothetical protein